VRRGEVYLVDLGPGVGREPAGRRPVVVVSTDILNAMPWVVAVVPGEDAARVPPMQQFGVVVPAAESGLSGDAVFPCFHARGLDPGRFTAGPVGRVPPHRLTEVENALRAVLDLP
jgi:mRNA interferase MazF